MVEPARAAALDVLRRVATQGAYAGAALRGALPAELGPADRGLATELVYGVLRRRGHLDRAIKRAAGRRLKDLPPRLHDVLRLGAYQLMYLDRVPAFAAVDGAVELAKGRGGARLAGAANRILRRLADTPAEDRIPPPPPLDRDPVAHVAAAGSVGPEVAAVLVEALGPGDALAFALASLQPAPAVLRVNRLRAARDAVAGEVGGVPGDLPWSVRLPEGGRVLPGDLACVAEGRATPQDEASTRVVDLLDPRPGERILDVCAAPGGKATAAAEAMGDEGEVVAHDRLPQRLARVEESAARLGLSCLRIAELLPPTEPPFDRVLVDAPCSGLGTLRRHPEIRWRFRRADERELARVQAKVLAAGAARVRPGGVLVYSVCTVTRSEGPGRVADLPGFALEAELSTGPHQPGAPDGFYAARLRRLSAP